MFLGCECVGGEIAYYTANIAIIIWLLVLLPLKTRILFFLLLDFAI